jgi:hypothetical protein
MKNTTKGTAIGPGLSSATAIMTKIGNSAALKNIIFAARRIFLRRGDIGSTGASSRLIKGARPWASHSVNPLSASPQREQNRISSETCC